jgi:hypothetical protein
MARVNLSPFVMPMSELAGNRRPSELGCRVSGPSLTSGNAMVYFGLAQRNTGLDRDPLVY